MYTKTGHLGFSLILYAGFLTDRQTKVYRKRKLTDYYDHTNSTTYRVRINLLRRGNQNFTNFHSSGHLCLQNFLL